MNRPPFSSARLSVVQRCVYTGLATAAAATFLGGLPGGARVQAALEDSPKTVIDEVWQIVHREYVDGNFNQVNWRQVRQSLLSRNYTSREQAYEALRAALKRLDDPYTRFLDPKQYQSLTDQTSGELSGIGIRLEVDAETGVLMVVEPLDGSPAAAAGLQTGDRIMQIGTQSTRGMTVQDAANLIRGEVGTKIDLQLQRGRRTFTVTITRARIELPTVRYTLKQDGTRRIGYIRLSEFSSHAAEQMRDAIRTLEAQNIDGFVLDLRGNPGGLLQSSVQISRMWLNEGTIVSMVDRVGKGESFAANQTALTDLPLVVLVDGTSASSSEILAGALMDNGRATIVGSQTFGKALVQQVYSLSDGSGLAVTVAHYYTPKGTDISKKGIKPHVQVDLTDLDRVRLSANPALIATPADPQFARAIAVLKAMNPIKPVVQTP